RTPPSSSNRNWSSDSCSSALTEDHNRWHRGSFLSTYPRRVPPQPIVRPGPPVRYSTGSILRRPNRYRGARSGAVSIEGVGCVPMGSVRRCLEAGYSSRCGLQLPRGGVRAVGEGAAALGFVVLTDRLGSVGQGQQRDQAALIRLMARGDRASAAPAGSAQCVQATVVPGTSIGVRGHSVALVQ